MTSYQPQPFIPQEAGNAAARDAALWHQFRWRYCARIQEVRHFYWSCQPQRVLVVWLVHQSRRHRLAIALALAIVIASWRDEGQTPGLLALLLIILYAIFALGIIVPALALTVRRLHDAGYSGLLVLLGLIPYLGSLIMLIFVLLPSSPAGVKYDPITATPDPYGPYPPQNLYPG